MISIDGHQMVGLFVFLRRHEMELDTHLVALYEKLERHLHSRLSIEQMESIETLYEQGIELFS